MDSMLALAPWALNLSLLDLPKEVGRLAVAGLRFLMLPHNLISDQAQARAGRQGLHKGHKETENRESMPGSD